MIDGDFIEIIVHSESLLSEKIDASDYFPVVVKFCKC